MKKIIISSYDSLKNPFYGGGGAIAIHEIGKYLSVQYELLILVGKYPGAQNQKIDGVSYKHISFLSSYPRISQLIFQLLLPLYSKILKYDLWIENFTPPFTTAFLPLFTNKPVIGLTQLLAAEEMSRKYFNLSFVQIEKFGLNRYKYIIATSSSAKAKILKINKSIKVALINNGISKKIVSYKNKNKSKPKHILFLGRIEIDQKGLDLLIKAYERIHKKAKLPLIIAGSGRQSDVDTLNRLIATSPASRHIRYIGHVSGEKKLNIFSKTSVFLFPSRYEVFPLTLLEAFAFKLPVIAFKIKDLSWLSETAVIKVDAFDINSYAKSIIKAINLSKLQRNKLYEKNKNLVYNNTWDKVAVRYERFINEILI